MYVHDIRALLPGFGTHSSSTPTLLQRVIIYYAQHEAIIIDVRYPSVKPGARSLQFNEVLGIGDDWTGVDSSLQTPELKRVAQSFTANFKRAITPARFVVHVVNWAEWYGSERTHAEMAGI